MNLGFLRPLYAQGLRVLGGYSPGNPSTMTLGGTNTYAGPTTVEGSTVLAIATIADGGIASPIGAASNAPANFVVSCMRSTK